MHRDYIEFNDRSIALAYMITFRCYGTWLHGDERGSVGRRRSNIYGNAKIKPSETLRRIDTDNIVGSPFNLGAIERKIVDDAIREVCHVRGYRLFALSVRTNHVHLVVNNGGNVERMMDSFKAYSTKALRNTNRIHDDIKPWSRHGSTRYLWTERHVELAVDYVVNGQGGKLPSFD
ncbi:MAG: transposase [Pyrinomonadaceae bacterium]